jgi:ATP-dependent Clp protease protease subunit
MSVIPFVVERDGNSERSYDIYSRLLKDRIIFIGDSISAQTASLVVAQLLFLEGQDSKRDINMYIHSPGAIYDTMQFIKPDISTFCMGSAASMASVLMAAGTKGKRSVLPHARIMIHQPMGGVRGQSSDIQIEAREILKIRDQMDQILSHHTGQSVEKINSDSDRNFWMNAQEALEYGLVDNILTNRD